MTIRITWECRVSSYFFAFDFSEWAANDVFWLKEEFMAGYETLAQQVVDYLFMPAPPPSPSPDAVDADLAW